MSQAWRDGGRPLVLVRSILERARTSLFTVPVIWVGFAIALTQLVTWIDVRAGSDDLPRFTETTVDSARSILSAISAGTITAASVVFSLTLVAIQLSNSVYTSRVLRSFLRDRFQQHMIGILLATFTYSLLVLSEVRGPLESVEEGGEAYVPGLSVFLAVVFAIVAVLALLASISHTSQSLRSSSVTRRLVSELVDLIRKTFPERQPTADASKRGEQSGRSIVPTPDAARAGDNPGFAADRPEPGAVLAATGRGWIQQISLEAIRDAVPEGTAIRLDRSVGDYVYEGAPLLTIWPSPAAQDLDDRMTALRGAFATGDQRSLQQDVAFGFMMIEDVAAKALSPGVNDPNTATEVIEQLGEAVLVVLEHEMPPHEMMLDGCPLRRASVATYDDMVVAAFNQIRHLAIGQPTVQFVLVRTLIGIGDELIRRRLDSGEAVDALRSMMRFVESDLGSGPDDPAATAASDALDSTPWYRS